MKILLTLILFTSIHLSSLAQNEIFRIDSIPPKGILLDKGWKWHAGDNPDFAKPDFDDSKWERIDPTKDVMDLKQFGDNNVGWFRLTFKIDSSIYNKSFALSIKQSGSSEIFLNSSKIIGIGEFSSKNKKSHGYDPAGTPFVISFGNSSTQNLSIRFEKSSDFLIKLVGYDNTCLKLTLIKVEKSIDTFNRYSAIDYLGQSLQLIISGFFVLIAFLHFWLYFDDRKYYVNLIFGIVSFLIATFFIVSIFLFHPINLEFRNRISIFLSISQPIINFSHFFAVNALFKNKNITRIRILLGLVTLSILLLFVSYNWGWMIGTLLVPFIISSQIITISYQAYKKGNKPAIGIAIAELLWIFLALGSGILYNISSTNVAYIAANIINYIGFIFPSLSIIYYFAYQHNANRKGLLDKIVEVQQLSEEKQESLLKQNAELQAALLQGQTIERKRVAADLHDSLGSTMSSLIYTVNAIDTNNLNKDEQHVYQHLKQMLDTAYNEIRLLSHNLLPEEFEKQGLAEALRHFVRKINQTKTIQFDLAIDPQLGRLSPKIEFELYSICLELINNILKHAHATKASVDLAREQNQVKLLIADNGRGFFDSDSDGKGMKNVKARVESLTGTWHIKNAKEGGVISEIVITM